MVLLTGTPSLRASPPKSGPADRILLGATVLSFHDGVVRSEAIALRDGRILAVGDRDSVLAHRGRGTSVLELPVGSAVIPGLIDAHAHLYGLGAHLSQLDLVDTESAAQIVALARRYAGSRKPGEWVVGRGWDQNDWKAARFPDHEELSAAVPDHPVLLSRVDGHAAWVNSRALEIAGIDADTPDPEGGRILRDDHGRPTGILVDAAVSLVRRHLPEPSVSRIEEQILAGQAACHRVGLTGLHEAGIGPDVLQAYRNLAARGALKLRVHAMLGHGQTELGPWLEKGPLEGDWLQVRSIKVYMDGALGSRGAALLEPYSDEPGNRGLLQNEPRDLLRLSMDAFRAGWQVCVHAIGDRANRLVLDTFEDALRRTRADPASVRPRIEHAQTLSREDIGRFAEIGVIASFQPAHCTSDMDWADERLGPDRLTGAYAWRSVEKTGAHIAFGSDFPVERPQPLEGIYAAVTRRSRRPPHTPAGGFHPGERVSIESAFRGFTSGAAYAGFQEERLGLLRPGAAADLVVLDRDPMKLEDPTELLETVILTTIVAGETVYEVEELAGR